MPATPDLWFGPLLGNIGSQTGVQQEPQITQLPNGDILVAWEDYGNDADASPGSDILANIFDPLGRLVTTSGPIRINQSFFLNDEGDFEVVGRPDGTFAVVYDMESTSGSSIRINIEDAAGRQVDFSPTTVYTLRSGGTLFDPSVAVAANGDMVVAFERTSGSSTSTYTMRYDHTTGQFTNTLNPVLQLASYDNGETGIARNTSVTALSNGEYLVVTHSGVDILARRVNADGTPDGAQVSVTSNIAVDRNAQVTALTAGSYVVAWEVNNGGDNDIMISVYGATGGGIRTNVAVASSLAQDSNMNPSVCALADGGFLITWYDNAALTVRGMRYDAFGKEVGSDFTIAPAFASNPQAVGLADGRIAVTWTDNTTLDVRMAIYDPRQAPNATPAYSPGWIVGTNADDDFSAGGAAFVHGWHGDDTIRIASACTEIHGDDGNDTVQLALVADTSPVPQAAYGDVGTDTLVLTSVAENATVDLNAGTSTDATGTMTTAGFERFTYAGPSDVTVLGTSVANVLVTGGGDDTLSGRGGADTLKARAGNDTLDGGPGRDTLSGGDGADRFVFSSGDTAAAGNRADTIVDFSRADGDTIDLSAIDANSRRSGTQHFSFIGAAAFTHQASELRYAINGQTTSVSGDIDGDGRADLTIVLRGRISFTGNDFILDAPSGAPSAGWLTHGPLLAHDGAEAAPLHFPALHVCLV